MWAAQFYRVQQAAPLDPLGGLGTMGFGLPAAMGVKMAYPRRGSALHHGRRLDPDVHPGALDVQAVQHARQDHPR